MVSDEYARGIASVMDEYFPSDAKADEVLNRLSDILKWDKNTIVKYFLMRDDYFAQWLPDAPRPIDYRTCGDYEKSAKQTVIPIRILEGKNYRIDFMALCNLEITSPRDVSYYRGMYRSNEHGIFMIQYNAMGKRLNSTMVDDYSYEEKPLKYDTIYPEEIETFEEVKKMAIDTVIDVLDNYDEYKEKYFFYETEMVDYDNEKWVKVD